VDNSEAVVALRTLLSELETGPQEYDFQPPALVSHVEAYKNDIPRLRKYATQVIGARIMLLLASTRLTTQALLQTFFLGVDNKNPFPMLLAARSQLELLSVVADTLRTIRDNSGGHEKGFASRVRLVDNALITATFGTRSSLLKGFLPKVAPTPLRTILTPTDIDVLGARNVLTRLEKLAKSGSYPDCMQDYERLCEYVHPNWGMNMLHLVPSPLGTRFSRLSLVSPDPFERAMLASVAAMHRSATATSTAFHDLPPPFGAGEVTYAHGQGTAKAPD
jgi:hypothetical protein